jgi:uridine kinase
VSWLAGQLAGRAPANGRHFLVAIDGRGGSGKSTLLSRLAAKSPELVACFGDDYFEPLDDTIEFGAFNDARFVAEVLEPVARGAASYERLPYVWASGGIERAGRVDIPQRGVFVIERCFSFALPATWDLRIWVETPREVCLERGLARDTPGARQVWEQVWQPREDAYIAEQRPRERADVVLDGTRPWVGQLGPT